MTFQNYLDGVLLKKLSYISDWGLHLTQIDKLLGFVIHLAPGISVWSIQMFLLVIPQMSSVPNSVEDN